MRVMGLDVGTRTIGVAVSDPVGLTAQGIEVIRRRDLVQDLSRLRELMTEYEVQCFVVGIPINMNGTYGPPKKRAVLPNCFGMNLTGLFLRKMSGLLQWRRKNSIGSRPKPAAAPSGNR